MKNFKKNFNKNFNKIFSKESFLVLGTIILNTINLILFSENNKLLLLNSIIILGLYFYISERRNKKVLFITLIHFAFYGVIFESLIIKHTNVLTYRNPEKNLNIPLWLFPVYCSFALGALETYTIINLLVG